LKVRELVIIGVVTERCVLFTAVDAHVLGYRLDVQQVCVPSAVAERHAAALACMARIWMPTFAPSPPAVPARRRAR